MTRMYLELQPMLFLAVFLYLWIHPLHQGVSLHQHVCEGGACEDADNLGLEILIHSIGTEITSKVEDPKFTMLFLSPPYCEARDVVKEHQLFREPLTKRRRLTFKHTGLWYFAPCANIIFFKDPHRKQSNKKTKTRKNRKINNPEDQ